MTAPTLTADELLAALDPTLPLPMALVKLGLTALADLSPAGLDGAASLELARELLIASDRVRVLALRAVADVDRRDLWVLDGAPSTGTWVADQPTGHTLIPHHITAYAQSGRTSLTDTALLCQHHHTDLHLSSRTLRLKDSRRINEAGWVDG